MEDYLTATALRGRDLTARTVGQALSQFHRWATAHGIDPLRASADQLSAYQTWLVTTYRSPSGAALARSTVATRLANLKGWYRWCAARRCIVADPARRLHVHIAKSRIVIHQPLSLQEATALLQSQAAVVALAPAGTHTHAEALRNLALLCLALATGRRIGGMTTLTVAQVDAANREVRIEREKGRMGRVLPVAGWAIDVIALYLTQARPLLARGHDAPWLFLSADGAGPITRDALRWMLAGLIERTQRDNPDLDELPAKRITWHSLRVSFATLLFAGGCDIRSVNELLLHRCLSTTARYTPVPVEDLRHIFRSAHPRP